MADNDKLELDLEDIIREFSEKPIKEKLSQSGDKMKDTIPLEDVVQASREQAVTAEEDTKRFIPPTASEDTKQFVPVSADEETRRFVPPQEAEETRRFTPVQGEEETRRFAEEDTTRIAEERKEPKVLRTPFQIMRRKIVEGPERQYYALREKGIAGIQTVMVLSFFVALVAIGTTVLYAMGYVPADRLRLMIFSQLLLLLFSAFLGAFQMVDGLFDLGRLRFTPNTLLALTFFVCLADCALCLGEVRVPCTAVFCIQVFMSLWGGAMQRKTDTSRTDTMRGAKMLSGIGEKLEFDGDVAGFIRCDGDVDDFMDTYGERGTPEKVLGWYCFGAFIASLIVGGVAVAMQGLSLGLQVAAASLLVAMPATMFITVARPALLLEKKLYKLGVVICGWEGAKGLGRKARFPITGKDLFPAEDRKSVV